MNSRVRKWVLRVAVTAMVLGAMPASIALAHYGGCGSSEFCAYRHSNYGTELVSSTTTTNGAEIDVANNLVSSGINHTSAYYCGVTAEGWPNQTVFSWANSQHTSYVGSSANDKIDHFYVRSTSVQCD